MPQKSNLGSFQWHNFSWQKHKIWKNHSHLYIFIFYTWEYTLSHIMILGKLLQFMFLKMLVLLTILRLQGSFMGTEAKPHEFKGTKFLLLFHLPLKIWHQNISFELKKGKTHRPKTNLFCFSLPFSLTKVYPNTETKTKAKSRTFFSFRR